MPFVDMFEIFGQGDSDTDPVSGEREYRKRGVEDEIRIVDFGDTRIFAAEALPFFFGNDERDVFLEMDAVGALLVADRRDGKPRPFIVKQGERLGAIDDMGFSFFPPDRSIERSFGLPGYITLGNDDRVFVGAVEERHIV